MPSVLIADDHAAVRAGVTAILSQNETIQVIGEATDGEQAVELAAGLRPDVLLLDIQMPGLDGIEACRRVVAAQSARVLMLTSFDLGENVDAALEAGAAGFVAKTADPQQLIAAVHAVADGNSYLTPEVTRGFIERSLRSAEPASTSQPLDLSELTDREQEILRLLGQGMTNKQIAEELVIAPATAKTHVSRVLQKLGVTNRLHAALLAGRDPGTE